MIQAMTPTLVDHPCWPRSDDVPPGGRDVLEPRAEWRRHPGHGGEEGSSEISITYSGGPGLIRKLPPEYTS